MFFIKIKTGCRCSRSFVLVILVSNCQYIFCRFQFLFSGKALFRFGQAKMAQMGHILLSRSLKQIGTSVYSSFKTMILQSFFI